LAQQFVQPVFIRAAQDYTEFRRYSDFLKVVMYTAAADPGSHPREQRKRTMLGDFSAEEVRGLTYKVQDYQGASLAELARKDFRPIMWNGKRDAAITGVSSHSPNRRPRQRLTGSRRSGLGGSTSTFPTGQDEKENEHRTCVDAVRAALGAGADG